jgi:GT2 family glycosyltransferase
MMAKPPPASVIVPTRDRPRYLDVALASIAPQAAAHGAEVIVVDDGPADSTRAVAERHGARYVPMHDVHGLNAARNAGIDAAGGDLLVFVDDDVAAAPGWLRALLAGPADRDVLTGPVRARFEDHPLRSCGREGPPITHLDLGAADTDADVAWGANLAIRRAALDRLGPFDAGWITGAGDEEEWVRRYRDAGGRIRYLAEAAVDHRRAGADARLGALARAAYARGRTARRFDLLRGEPPRLEGELRVLAGCVVHAARRRCANGLVMAAHSAGRLREAAAPDHPPPPEDVLAGRSGEVGGRRGALRRAGDRALDLAGAPARARLRRAAAGPGNRRHRVLVVGAHHMGEGTTTGETVAELHASRHDVTIDFRPRGTGGKFENVNEILAEHDVAAFDWVLVVDDDVALPRGFLDGLLHLADRHGLRIVQPAQTLASHAAWPIVRRRFRSAVRRTTFVEIGPVTAFGREAAAALIPFPDLRQAWGLDLHWAAVARDRGWPVGIVDLLPVRHELRKVAATYPREEAVDEARAFLADRPYLRSDEVRTLAVHRSW